MEETSSGQRVQYYGTGRRKSSVARVFLRPGQGEFHVNRRPLDAYFLTETLRVLARFPLQAAEATEKFDVLATVSGGGMTGQAGAVRLGVARALVSYDPEMRGKLKKLGLLTRDARIKERKKYGQKGARKRFQFSKR
ncbi:MAG: 30S ribosomal protein S9 [Acidobacteria bacterium]|nr:30S ribosomal protein S9 [Acidobacteriota bacterium]